MTKQNSPAYQRFEGFRGISPALRRVYEEIDACAKGELRCLFLGPRGSGKELLAAYYYQQLVKYRRSDEAKTPYHAINCACLVDTLAISQLFGHVAGAFTGAKEDSPGLFGLAAGGVLFLDEIGDLPASLDAALNQALNDDKPIARKIGSSVAYSTEDVRAIAATEKPENTLRQSLRDRFQAFILVPSLEDRPEDIRGALAYFFEHAVLKRRRANCSLVPWPGDELPAGLSPAMAEDLEPFVQRRSWPGNFRALRSLMDFAVMIASGEEPAGFCRDVREKFLLYLDRYSVPREKEVKRALATSAKTDPTVVDTGVLDRLVKTFPGLSQEERAKLAAFLVEQRGHLFRRDDLERESSARSKSTVLGRLRRLREAGLIVEEEGGRGELYRVTLERPARPPKSLVPPRFLALPLDVTWPKGVRKDLKAIRELLEKSRIVFVGGDPGVGKTVCAQALGTDLSRDRAVSYYPFGDRGVPWFFTILQREMERRQILETSPGRGDREDDVPPDAASLAEPIRQLFASEERPVLILDNVDLISDPQQEKALLAMLLHWGNDLSFVLVGKKLRLAPGAELSLPIVEYTIMKRSDLTGSEEG